MPLRTAHRKRAEMEAKSPPTLGRDLVKTRWPERPSVQEPDTQHHEATWAPRTAATSAGTGWLQELIGRLETESPAESVRLTSGALRIVFDDLVAAWKSETRGESFPHRRALHFAYQEIIGLGPDAVPLILESLEAELDDWFWALAAITRFDPAEGISRTEEAAARWLDWGRDTGQLRVGP